MPNFIDLSGRKFGKLTVTGFNEEKSRARYKYWNCECNCDRNDCLKNVAVSGNSLKKGSTRSCGSRKFVNLTEQTFGRLNVIGLNKINLEETPTRIRYRSYWDCKCLCGNLITRRGDRLQSGKNTTCGCSRNHVKPIKFG